MANSSKNTVTTITFTKKTIALIVAALGALLIFIGLFGDSLVIAAKSGSITAKGATINLEYIFKTGWEGIAETPSAGFQKFMLIVAIASFFVGVLGVIYVVARNSFLIYKKEDIKFSKSFALLSAFGLQAIIVPRMLFSFGMSHSRTGELPAKTLYQLGWGSILITIGFFIALIGLIINEIDSGEFVSQNNIAIKIIIVLSFFVALFGVATIGKYVTTTESSGIITKDGREYSSFFFYTLVLELADIGLENYAAIKALTIISIILTVIGLGCFLLALYNLIKGNLEKNGKKMIAFSISYFISNLLGNILLSVAIGMAASGTDVSSGFNSTAIAGTVLGALFAIASIVLVSLRNKTIKFAKGK